MSPLRRSTTVLAVAALVSIGLVWPAQAAFPPDDDCTVKLTGVAGVDQTLTATITNENGTPDAGRGYYWTRSQNPDGTGMASTAQTTAYTTSTPTTDTYHVTEQDYGLYISVHAFGNGAGSYGENCYAVAAKISRVGTPVTSTPVITGKPKKGKTLTASVGTLLTGTTASYQWFRIVKKRVKKHTVKIEKAIPGATATTYKTKGKDRHRKVFVKVTYTRTSYNPTVLSSNTKKIR